MDCGRRGGPIPSSISVSWGDEAQGLPAGELVQAQAGDGSPTSYITSDHFAETIMNQVTKKAGQLSMEAAPAGSSYHLQSCRHEGKILDLQTDPCGRGMWAESQISEVGEGGAPQLVSELRGEAPHEMVPLFWLRLLL